MFSTLLGTPRGGAKGPSKTSLEFTPIGKPSKRTVPQFSPEDKENQGPSYRLNHGKVLNQHMMDSSFDNTVDHFSPSQTLQGAGRAREPGQHQDPLVRVQAQRVQPQPNLIGGLTSIKEQQKQFDQLETENYNLKIKLATLTRYFDQSPEDQKDLINQNIDLKQQLMEAAKQMDRLNLELNDLKYESAHPTASKEELEDRFHQEIETLKSNYVQLLQEKDEQLGEYSTKLERLEANHHHDYSSKFEAMERGFEDEIETIKLRYKDLIESKDNQLRQMEDKLNSLQETSREVDGSEGLKSRLNDLEWENQQLKEVVSDYKGDGEAFEELNSKLKADFNHLNNDMEAKEHELVQLKNEARRYKELYDNMVDEQRGSSVSSDDLSRAKEEIILLRAKVDELDYKYQTAKSQLERSRKEAQDIVSQQYDGRYSTEKLQRQVDFMAKQLEDRDVIESKLRAQIDALINERPNIPKDNYHFYEAQIESLSAREAKLTEINKNLNGQIAQLKDEIYHLNSSSNTSDSRLNSLQRQVKELSEKLGYYEEEYEKAESSKKAADNALDELQARFSRLDSEYKVLEQDNVALVNQIRNQQKNSDSALDQLEAFNKKKMELENIAMAQEIESLHGNIEKLKRELEYEGANNNSEELKFEIRTLKRELDLIKDNDQVEFLEAEIKRLRKELSFEQERNRTQLPVNSDYRTSSSSNERFLENEYHRVTRERDQLQLNMDETTNRLRDLENKYKRAQFSLQDKETMIDDMQLRLRDMKRASKFESLEDDDEKAQLFKTNASNEAKIKVLQLEKQTLQQELESKMLVYQERIDLILKSQASTNNEGSGSIISLLEKQLGDFKVLKAQLSDQLDESIKKQKELSADLEKAHKETSHLHDLNHSFERNERALKLENDQLEARIKSTTQELDKVTSHCHRLVTKLVDLRAKPEADKLTDKALQRRIDELNLKMNQTHISSPTPRSSSKSVFLEEQLKYYKAKLYDINMKANDLELMYSFVINSVKNSNKLLKNDMDQLQRLGIYPDYQNPHKKVTFAGVAKLVLSMVRIKRRYERAEKRKRAIVELRHDIDKKRF